MNEQRRDPEAAERVRIRAVVHLWSVCELYQMQIDAGRYFLHEHPASATSWPEACIQTIMAQDGVDVSIIDQCQYGQATVDGQPIQKATKWMSNSPRILQMLQKRCSGRGGSCSRPRGGQHQHVSGRVCRKSQEYPFELRKAILMGCCASSLMMGD